MRDTFWQILDPSLPRVIFCDIVLTPPPLWRDNFIFLEINNL